MNPTIDIIEVTSAEQMEEVSTLAKKIWNEHYVSIIGQQQVDYMLEKFQSPAAIQQQIVQGYCYQSIVLNNKMVGYYSYQLASSHCFLSKFYLDKPYRGLGIARQGLTNLETSLAKTIPLIRLTVNKDNSHSVAAYQKLGFTIIDEVVTDIGYGFVMDDFVMEKSLADERLK